MSDHGSVASLALVARLRTSARRYDRARPPGHPQMRHEQALVPLLIHIQCAPCADLHDVCHTDTEGTREFQRNEIHRFYVLYHVHHLVCSPFLHRDTLTLLSL